MVGTYSVKFMCDQLKVVSQGCYRWLTEGPALRA